MLDYLFSQLNLHRVRANCDAENLASERPLERLGMAHIIECLWFKRRWSSEIWYAILRREWVQMRAVGYPQTPSSGSVSDAAVG